MPRISGARHVGACVLACAMLLATRESWAVDCTSLPSPVIGQGGSATKPILAKLAKALANASPPQTVIYQAPGACNGINSLLGSNPTPLTGTASYWDTTGAEQTCDLPIQGAAIDFANMVNSALLCPGVTSLPAGYGDFLGPVSTFNIIVPKASSQLSISSEAAYFVFGFGAAGQAAPWTDESQIFVRDSKSAAQLFVGLAAGVPPDKFKGVNTNSNQGTVTAVSAAVNPEAAIGIVSGEVAAANTSVVTTLAYQHKDQTCGYWPDSTADATDKRNVRSGQYYIWSPIHFFAKVDGSNTIIHPGARNLIGYFTGDVAPPAGVNILDIEIKASTVPKCAMESWRETDLGPIQSYAPADPCGCYFESVATGTTSCQSCTNDQGCTTAGSHCRYGFCEAY